MPLPKKKGNMPEIPDDFQPVSEEVSEDLEPDISGDLPNIDDSKSNYQYDGDVSSPMPSYSDYMSSDIGSEETQEQYKEAGMDKKAKKIKPSGKKYKKTLKAGDFDHRKNIRTAVKIWRALIFIVLMILIGYGFKNTFFPSNNFTRQEIVDMVKQASGNFGFPQERGAAIATEFVAAYLKYSPEVPDSEKELGYFLTGKYSSTINNSTQTIANTSRKIIGGPTVTVYKPLSSTTGNYIVTALVSENGGFPYRRSLSVNVVYNPELNQFIVDGKTVSLVPSPQIEVGGEVPPSYIPGTQEQVSDKTPFLSTIRGFFDAYSKVTPNSHEVIDQYVSKTPTPELLNGFGGSVALNGSPSEAISQEIYTTSDPNNFIAVVNVQWTNTMVVKRDEDSKFKQPSITFSSKYVISINKTADGKFLVENIAPYPLIPKEEK